MDISNDRYLFYSRPIWSGKTVQNRYWVHIWHEITLKFSSFLYKFDKQTSETQSLAFVLCSILNLNLSKTPFRILFLHFSFVYYLYKTPTQELAPWTLDGTLTAHMACLHHYSGYIPPSPLGPHRWALPIKYTIKQR